MLDGKGQICEKCLDGNFNHCKENKCIHGSKLMSALATYEANQISKRHWYSFVDKFVCPSNFYYHKLSNNISAQSSIVFLRNPLPLDTRYEVHIENEKYVLYFGRLSWEKGVKTLIDAMEFIDYKLLIVGSGPIEKELKDYVIKKSVKNNIHKCHYRRSQKGAITYG